LVILIVSVLTGHAQISKFRAARFHGEEYVALADLARHFELGADQSASSRRGSYRGLIAEADDRSIQLDGVAHWLSNPIVQASGRLWIGRIDVLKQVDPILRPSQFASRPRVRRVLLDAGHGGSDRGTRGRKRVEKELTLDVAQRVKTLLDKQGLNVLMTRTSDRTLALSDRTDDARSRGADLFVSIHFNAAVGSASGIETFCLPPKGYPSTSVADARRMDQRYESGNKFDLENVWLAHCVQQELIQETKATDRGVRRARFQVLRDAPCPAVLIECGFLSNRAEEERILTTSYRETLARAIAGGIMDYVNSTGAS
jgi:N-acetylmuramoyl-L-alanine amidase